jgi:APA family basic amino acid/polyamine antiporter
LDRIALTPTQSYSLYLYALTALVVVVLRRTRPDAPRPCRVFGCPYVPIIFVLGSAWFLVNTLMEEPVEAGCGAAMLGVGVRVYRFWKRRAAPGPNRGASPPLSPM